MLALGRQLNTLAPRMQSAERESAYSRRVADFLIRERYSSVAADQSCKSEINAHELKTYSQNGEDGILLFIFSRLGVKYHRFIEFGIQDGRECNTANLSLNFGWRGLLMDGDEAQVQRARQYYVGRLGDDAGRVRIERAFITAENVDAVISGFGCEGDIDLLSIDIDGNDYHVWKSITVVRPRVVVIEYNTHLGPERSLTVKYDPEFRQYEKHPSGWYFGASLVALTRLAGSRGYRLVGCDSNGINAFFVLDEEAGGRLAAVEPRQAYYPLSGHWRLAMARRAGIDPAGDPYELIKHLEFETV